jgi:hypothetical protein
MNNLVFNQQSSTIGTLVILSGMLACSSLTGNANRLDSTINNRKEVFNLANNSSTFSEFQASIFKPMTSTHTDRIFEQTVIDFYAKLVADQEPLGAEFEAVLHENLWDLYKR